MGVTTVPVQVPEEVSEPTFEPDQVDLFNKYIENHRQYASYSADELADYRDRDAEEIRALSRYWTALADEPVDDAETAEQLRDAFNIDVTIYGTAEYADVHPARAWGYWQRNRDGLGSFPREPQRTELQPGDDIRITILDRLKDGDAAEAIIADIDQSATRLEPVIDTYEENTAIYQEKLAADVVNGR